MLTKKDVEELLRHPAAETRAALAFKMADTLQSAAMTLSELEIAQDIIRKLAADIDSLVRRTVAENLRASARLPHDVALRLAHDIVSVAAPVLESSPVLHNEDLIEIIKTQEQEKDRPEDPMLAARQTAVARRSPLSRDVADTLAEHGSESALAALVANKNADLSDKGLARVVDRFGDSRPMQETLARRPHLPVTLAERLVSLVSDNLRDYLIDRHISPAIAAELIVQSRECTTLSYVSKGAVERDVEKLAMQMLENGRLTPSVIVRALCMGEIGFFEAAIAVLADIPIVNARILIHDSGSVGFRSVYDKAKMPPSLFEAMNVALDVLHEIRLDGGPGDRTRYQRQVIERVLTQFQGIGEEDMDYLLHRLKNIAPESGLVT